jgi:hypothetical protein
LAGKFGIAEYLSGSLKDFPSRRYRLTHIARSILK